LALKLTKKTFLWSIICESILNNRKLAFQSFLQCIVSTLPNSLPIVDQNKVEWKDGNKTIYRIKLKGLSGASWTFRKLRHGKTFQEAQQSSCAAGAVVIASASQVDMSLIPWSKHTERLIKLYFPFPAW